MKKVIFALFFITCAIQTSAQNENPNTAIKKDAEEKLSSYKTYERGTIERTNKPKREADELATKANASDISSSKLEIFETKLDLLQKINEKLMQSVYWTLGTLAAIFSVLITVNLYFNISANKKEIEKIRQDIDVSTKEQIKTAEISISNKNIEATLREMNRIKEEIETITGSSIKTVEANLIEKTGATTQREVERIKEEIETIIASAIKTVEASLIEKTNIAIEREIKKESTNVLNVTKNEILSNKAEITELYTNSENRIEKISNSLTNFEIKLKELQVYKFSQEGKMGAIIYLIDLLKYDIENQRWNLEYRLPEILNELKTMASLPDVYAKKLYELLKTVTETEHKEIVKATSDLLIKINPNVLKEQVKK